MLYRRKKNIVDPTRINNYNKFLTTLDRTSTIPTIFTTKNYANLLSSINNKTHKDNHSSENITSLSNVCDFKNAINKIVDQITQDYNVNNYSSPNFTGYNPCDSCCINNSEHNYYRDTIQKPSILNYNRPYISSLKIEIPKTPPPIEIKETIYIDTEINNISDILKLIETYKIDPSIKYNINMRVLHDIKEPLEELNNMIGINDLKNNIVDQILYFVQELHKGNKTKGDFMHTVIYGPPGTGKTEIAKIMGKLYSKIGVLTKGTFKKVTRSDLIAGYLGQTAIKTSDVIKSAIGGVLFIEEAYALGNPEKRDSFAKECIDTLCEALSDNKENLMVIIAGYEQELKESFFSFNQGLESRFTWRFKTDEYNGDDLYNIFVKMVGEIGWEIEPETKISAEWFKQNKDYFQYFGRDIETLLSKTKISHSRRVFCLPDKDKKKITLKDLDKGLEIFLRNDDVKNRKNDKEMKRYLYNTLYS